MKLLKIETGHFNADGGACFGVVPKRVWQKRYPCDDQNFCKLMMRCLLVDTGSRVILIDNGTGNKQKDYFRLYGIKDIIDFETELNKAGYSCGDITDVILTHLHFDHCGACTYYADDNKTLSLTFPNATHWVGERQWQNAMNPNVREGDSYFPENMLPVKEAGKLKLITENQYICPEVEVRLFHGHTVGQLAPYIYMEDKTLIYVGDVIPTSVNVPLAWVSSYDTFPITSMEDKKKLMTEAVSKNQYLFFEHDAYTECCTVTESAGKFKVLETCTLDEFLS